LQSVLGTALLATRGYTAQEVREAFTRAQELSEQIDNTDQLFQIVVGLWMYYQVSGQNNRALDTGSQLLRIAKDGGSPGQMVQAHYSIAYTHLYRGELEASKQHFEQALASEVEDGDFSSQSASGDDTRTHVRCMIALVYWYLGLPETALRYATEAAEMADSLEHPFAITFVSFINAWLHLLRREPGPAAVYANQCVRLAEENGYRFFSPLGRFVQAASDGGGSSLKMKSALQDCQQAGITSGSSFLMFQLVEALLADELFDEALEQLELARQHIDTIGEAYLDPEYYRINGILLLARFKTSNDGTELVEAIEFLTKALARARLADNKGLQLRAATDLAEALQQSSDTAHAVQELETVIKSFEEFDDSGDCIRAQEVLKNMR